MHFGLISAGLLLILLLVFYLGGRYILINILRQAEREITVVSENIKSAIAQQVRSLQDYTRQTAGGYAVLQSAEERTGFLKKLLQPNPAGLQAQLAAELNPDGSLREGYYSRSDRIAAAVEPEMLSRYFNPESDLQELLKIRSIISGVISFQEITYYISITPVCNNANEIRSIIIIGLAVQSNQLYEKISGLSEGLAVLLHQSGAHLRGTKDKTPLAAGKPAPIFEEDKLFSAGGQWHIGNNDFMAVIPIHDILGDEISSLSIRLPRSFSSLTTMALASLTAFVAVVGIIFIVPVFWLQSRIILDPLARLERQIRDISSKYKENKIEYLNYTSHDEFGTVARSVDNLLQELNSKSQQVFFSAQRQKALIDSIPDCLCIFSKAQALISIEKQPDNAAPIPGLTINQPLADEIFKSESLVLFSTALANAFESAEIQSTSLICRDISTQLRYFETRITRMDDHFALVVFRDVTADFLKRKKKETIETRASKVQQMSSLGNLAASIAHDFNNVFTIIKNTLFLMGSGDLRESAAQEVVFTLKQATNKGTTLVQELMTYAGQTNTNMQRQSPGSIIMELHPLYKGIIQPGVTLEIANAENLHAVMVDTDQFWKVIVNLVKNAAESIKSSRGYIKISTYNFEITKANAIKFFSSHPLEPDQGVIFEVADNGEGIPQDIIDRLFEPFFSTKSVGRGLGLATVFGIVDSHNGGISIVSYENIGTKFRVWLPAAPALPESDDLAALNAEPLDEGPLTAGTVTGASASGRSGRPRVLIIDDDPSIIKTTALLLSRMGVDPLTAATRNEAVARFRKCRGQVDLVMLDAQLGNLDSVRLLATLRMSNEQLPIVICSGHTQEKVSRMFKDARIDGILIKPYTMDELKSMLSQFMVLDSPAQS